VRPRARGAAPSILTRFRQDLSRLWRDEACKCKRLTLPIGEIKIVDVAQGFVPVANVFKRIGMIRNACPWLRRSRASFTSTSVTQGDCDALE